MLLDDEVSIAAAPSAIWRVLDDPSALARVLPGCEELAVTPDGALRGVLASGLGFMTVRADVVAVLRDLEPPRSMRLDIQGHPRALAGSFSASIPFELEPSSDGATRIRYRVELALTGRLASFGAPLLRDVMRRQVSVLARNLERELGPPAGTARP